MEMLARYRGCLLGGAVGDALGAPVEFLSLAEIRAQFGTGGIRDFAPAYGLVGAITDDTQMTLFTAEGLLRAHNRGREKGIVDTSAMVHRAYLRWLATQGEASRARAGDVRDGWLVGLPELHDRRAPGNTCLSALRGERAGAVDAPVNGSKGCGGVMRAAPAGLAWPGDVNSAFTLGCETAAITHGHPGGFLSAGFLAATIAAILGGAGLGEAVLAARALLRARPGHEECLAAVDAALALAERGPGTPEAVERLGGGWVGEEALAIALYCALVADDFAAGVVLAVNHGGDSDSTGAIAGNLLGALLGEGGIPADWLGKLELRKAIGTVAGDLYGHFVAGPAAAPLGEEGDWERYPGW